MKPAPTKPVRRSPRHGQLVDLLDQGDEFYVYGHVTTQEFTDALAGWWEEAYLEDDEAPPPAIEEPRHRWARWGFASSSDLDGQRELILYKEPGRGRFRISAARTVEYAAERQAVEARREWAKAEVLRRWPEAVIDHVWGGHVVKRGRAQLLGEDPGVSVSFHVPGVTGLRAVRWESEDPEHVHVIQAAVDAWNTYVTQGLAGRVA